MKIATAEVFAYSLPLTVPLQVASRVLDRRDGWLLRVCTTAGAEGWGEVAPLPGFSPESPAEARSHLIAVAQRLVGQSVAAEELRSGLPGALISTVSSVRFGVESALVHAIAGEGRTSSARWLGAEVDTGCILNALVFGSLPDCVERARAAVDQGYTAIKLKVGRASVEEDAERVTRVAELLPASVGLRLDANRAWSWAEAVDFAGRIAGLPLAYVEEPLQDATGLANLHAATGWPLALDESLHEAHAHETVCHGVGVVAWVIKPTLVGGLLAAAAWQDRAVTAGVQPVLSSSLESGVGLRMVAELATRQPGVAIGLDTYRSLADDLLTPRLDMAHGRVDLPTARRAQLQQKRLVKLS